MTTSTFISFDGMEFPQAGAPPVHPPFDIPVREAANEVAKAEEFILRDTESLVIGGDPVIVSKADIDADVIGFLYSMTNLLGSVALSGGAIRDVCVGQEPSDYDFFTTVSFNDAVMGLESLERVEQGSLRQVVAEGGAKGPEYSGNVHYVLEFFIDGVDQPIQLIGVDNIAKEVCQQFPVGVSRCMLTTSGFSCTQSFLRDMYKEQFTVMNASTLRSSYVKKMKLREELAKWKWVL